MIFVQGSLYRERIVDTLMSKVIQFRDKVSPVKTNTTCQQNLERNHDNIISQKKYKHTKGVTYFLMIPL